MQAIAIGVVTTLVGIIVTILISRHYYSRSSKHRLAVYWLPSPSILQDVDPDIRGGLSIEFRGEAVKELSVSEFLIANEGVNPVRDPIRPLTFNLGDKCRIVDASVTYVHPEGREVAVEMASDHIFRCSFSLLNPREYFYVKLIADGRVSSSEVSCTIVAEDLPPRLEIESAAGVSIGEDDRKGISRGLFGAGLLVLAIGASIFLPVLALYESDPAYFPFTWSKFTFVWWLAPAMAIAAILAFVIVVIGLVMTVNALVGNIPRKQRFRRPGRPYVSHYIYSPYTEIENAASRYPRE